MSKKSDSARRGLNETQQHTNRRSLTRAVRPQEAVDSSFRHLNINPINGRVLPEAARKCMSFNYIGHEHPLCLNIVSYYQ
jgi:hypothetical protein